jgi:hypothetical protein
MARSPPETPRIFVRHSPPACSRVPAWKNGFAFVLALILISRSDIGVRVHASGAGGFEQISDFPEPLDVEVESDERYTQAPP